MQVAQAILGDVWLALLAIAAVIAELHCVKTLEWVRSSDQCELCELNVNSHRRDPRWTCPANREVGEVRLVGIVFRA